MESSIITPSSSRSTFIRRCGAIALVCAAWNLWGDLYYLDVATAQLETLAQLKEQEQPGYLFSSPSTNHIAALIAQAGGWMYPVWALVTVVPLWMGLQPPTTVQHERTAATFPQGTVPCALLAYGLCVVGGALHNAFAFITILPGFYFARQDDNENLFLFLQSAQERIVRTVFIGCLPGLVACNVACIGIAWGVQSLPTHFSRKWRFHLCNPLVTSVWVPIVGSFMPMGMYFVGCLGTWGVLMLNIGTTLSLWNLDEVDEEAHLRNALLLRGPPKATDQVQEPHEQKQQQPLYGSLSKDAN